MTIGAAASTAAGIGVGPGRAAALAKPNAALSSSARCDVYEGAILVIVVKCDIGEEKAFEERVSKPQHRGKKGKWSEQAWRKERGGVVRDYEQAAPHAFRDDGCQQVSVKLLMLLQDAGTAPAPVR